MKKPKLSKKIILIAAIVLVLIVAAIAVIFFVFRSDDAVEASDENAITLESDSETPTEIAKIGQDKIYYSFYNQIGLLMSKEAVNARLGMEPIMEADGAFHYTDISTGYSVVVYFNVNDQVVLKALIPPIGGGDWIKLCKARVTEDQVEGITEGMSYQEVKDYLGGEGLLRIEMIQSGSADHEVYGLVWMNQDSSYILVSFDGVTGKVIGSKYQQ
ncbi:hypothetical protein Q5O24_02485 [Eubacteriaceae bacterium ES3]|nr:hypothetical protein Q5O24_02485 [Eubacteriaceae bacterium ES3]